MPANFRVLKILEISLRFATNFMELLYILSLLKLKLLTPHFICFIKMNIPAALFISDGNLNLL